MNKKYVFVKRFSLFLSVFILLFTACKENIGLGESIDTKAPSLEITYPVQKAVIMDYFYIGGNCSDDKGVKNVQVTLKKLGTVQETIGSYPAEIKNGTEWFIKFNEKDSEGLYPLKDGSYIAYVTAWDNAGQNSGTSSISFDIDNTPPVFIATNPGVTESSSRYSKYGSSFTLKGTKADEHTVASISVTVYGEDGTVKGETDQNPFVQTNISTDEVEILFARAKGYDEEKVNYARLYDMSNEHYGKEEKYSCSITLTDSAKLYQKVGDGGKEKGNSTSSIFLNDDIYDSLLSPSKGFALTANSIMTVLNGTRTESFKKGSESEGSVTEITVNKIKEILEQNIKVTASEVSENVDRLSFSLNPKANPIYKNTDELEITSGTPKSLLAKSSINFTVELGLDKVNLFPGTFKVWIKEYDEIPSQETLLEDRLKIEDYVYQNQSQIPSGWVKIYEADKNQSSSSVACSVKVALDSSDQIKVKVGKFYSIALTGWDQENEFVEAESIYGFTGEASGKKPEISIDTPAENNKYFASSDKIEFTGKISATEEPLSLLAASIEFLKNGETTAGENFDFPISFKDGKWQNTEYLYVDEGFDVSSGSGTYHFIPSKHPDYEKFAVKDEESGEYTFTFTINAENESQERSLSARVDSVKPKVYLSAISPVVKGSDYKESSNESLYVNGTVKFEGRVEETNLASDKITWQVLDSEGKVLSEDYFPEKSLSFSKEIDTAAFENSTEIEIVVCAQDIVGNKGSYSSKEYTDGKYYIVDQNSDKPVVQLKNANKTIDDIEKISVSENSFDCQYAKATINGTVTDDDGVKEVLVKIYDSKEGTTPVYEDQKSSPTNKNTTSYDFKFDIPNEEGEYWIEITARDKNFKDSEKTPYSEIVEERFCVLVDNGKPEIKCENEIPDFTNEKLTFTVSVTDPILKSITVGISKNGEALSDTESGSYYKVDLKEKKAVITIPAELKNNGTWSFTVNAEDSLEKTNTSNFGPVVIDTETPNLTVTKKPSAYVDKNSAQIFEGTVVEETSGISEVVYWIEGTKNGESYTTVEEAASVKGTKNNAGTITENITFKASVDISEFDENTDLAVYFKAADNAGNDLKIPPETLKLDATKPSVTFTVWDDSNPYTSIKELPLSGTVTEKNLSSLVLTVYKNDEQLVVAKEWTKDEIAKLSTGNAENWKFDYDVAVDGKYSFVISAEDKAGLKDTVTSKTVYVDTTGPELFVVDNANTLTNGIYDYSKYTFTGSWSDSLSGTQTLMYSVNGNETSITDFAGQKTWRIENVALTEGANTFEFWGKDKNGNESAHVKMENVMVDFAEPVVSLTYKVGDGEATSSVPSFIADGAVLTVSGTVTESNGVKAVNVTAKKGGTEVTSGSNGYSVVTNPESKTFTITLTGGNESSGEWSFDVEAVDNAGRKSSVSNVKTSVDTEKPSITAKNDAEKEYIDRNATNKYSGTITETGGSGIKGVYWKAVKHPAGETIDTSDIASASWQACSVDASLTGWSLKADLSTLEEGEGYRIFFAAVDNAGNISELKYVDQYLDNTAPKVEELRSSYGVETKKQTLAAKITEKYLSELSLEVTKGGVKDEAQSFTYRFNDTEGKGKDWFESYVSGSEYSFTISGDGSYVVKLTATDKAENKTTVTFESFIIDTTLPELTVNSESFTNGIYDSKVYTFTGTWSDSLTGTKKLWYKINGTEKCSEDYAGQKNWRIENVALKEGENTFEFWGEDGAGNKTSPQTFNVTVDFASPALTNKQSLPEYIAKDETKIASFTFGDSYGIENIVCTATLNGKSVTEGFTYEPPAIYSQTAEGKISIKADSADKNGQWVFHVKAIDLAERESPEITLSTFVDSEIPLSLVSEDQNYPFCVQGKPVKDSWYSQNSLTFRGYFKENGSGIKTVFYFIENTSYETAPTDLTEENAAHGYFDVADDKSVGDAVTYGITTDKFEAGINTIHIQAIDKAGNKSAVSKFIVNVDMENPEFSSSFYTFDSAPKQDSYNAQASGTILGNGKNNLTLFGKVSDEGSGIDKIDFYLGGKTENCKIEDEKISVYYTTSQNSSWSDYISATYETFKNENYKNYKGWKAVIDKSKVETGSLYAFVYDKANNSVSPQILTINLDNNSPQVKISTTSNSKLVTKSVVVNGNTETENGSGETVKSINGEANFTGNASDDYTVSSISLYYSTTNSETDYSNDTKVGVLENTSAYSWSFTEQVSDGITMLDNVEYTGEAQTVYFKFVCKDTASNESVYVYQYSVDPNADRPVFNITNLSSGTKGESGNILKYDTVLTGTVTDDDELESSEMKIYEVFDGKIKVSETEENSVSQINPPSTQDEWDAFEQKQNTLKYDKTTGDWSYTPLSTIDGQKLIYIYFKDSKGSSFWTGYNLQTGSSPDVVEKQNKVYMPKVQFKRNEQKIYGSTQYLSYSTDGNSPEITGFQIAIGKTQEEAENANFEDISVVYGGKEKRFAKIKITAKDANGIKNLTATLNDEDLQLTGSPTEDFSESVWYTQTVDLSSYRQESVSLVAKAWDGSGLFSNRTGTIKNDYEIPENFSIVLPKTKVENGSRITAETLTGSVEISGTANDGNGSGLKSIKWLIPAKDQTVETLVSDYTEGSSYDEYITKVATSDSKYKWIDFTEYGNNSTADWKLLFNGEEGRQFLKDFCDTTKYCVTLSNYIYSIPMVFRLEDNLGNIRIVSDFKIQFNPNADWPVAKIIYPTTATGTDDEGNALITKVGGTVRVTGSATDNISVSKVYVQISTTKDDAGNIVWKKDDEALESGRTLAQSNSDSTYLEAVDFTAKNLSGLVKDSNFNVLSDGWGILASNSISWFLEINKFGELNNKTVWIRSAAVDLNESGNEFNLGLWSEPQCVAFDADVPILGKQSKSNIISVFENNAAGSSSKTLINRTYTSDMHISNKDGKWYFALSAEDTSGIKEITVKKTVGGNTAETICTAKWDASSETEGQVNTQNGVIFESHQYAVEQGNAKSYYDKLIYLPIDTSSDGYISYTVTAYEGTDTRLYSSGTYTFNIDNSSPELTPLVSEDTRITNADKLVAGNKLVNSNGSRITLSGKVTDSGTGFDKLALYFVRDEKLLNPFPQKSEAGWTSCDAKEIKIKDLSTAQNSQDGLHGKIINGTINGTDNSFTASESLNENIRVGGLARINGAYYIIRSVSDKTVTVDADIPLVSSGENKDEVFFPYAFVVQYNTSWINKEDFKDSTNYSSPVYTISEDDGDGIMQNVEKDGTTWEWSIYIPSHKIPDGKIQIYWTAFDKAGNSSSDHVDTMISNNLPRLSKIFLATDLNGNGDFDNDEFAYTSVDSNGKEVKNYGYSALDINEKPQEIVAGIETDYTYLNENNEEVIGHFYVRDKLNVAMEFTSQGSQTLYVNPALGNDTASSPKTGQQVTQTLDNFNNLSDVKAQKYISIEKESLKTLAGYNSSMENSKDNIKSQNGKVPVKTYLQLDIWDNVNIKENSAQTFIATKDTIDQSSGLVTEYGNQFTVLNIPFYLDIEDDNPPEISINSPVAVENEGHVELGDDEVFTALSGTLDKDDKISGKVIFTGVLQDDRKIASVKLKSSRSINSSLTSEVEVASYDENTALLKTTEAAAANDAWKFEIVTEDSAQFSKSEGHRVEWKLTLDSSFVENTAQNDVTFTLSASDALQSGNSGSTQKQVDIVPYITNIETSLSSVQKRNPSVFDRSTYGHYSVSDSETINIYGYNINGGSAVDKKGTTVVLNSAQRTSDSSIYGKTGTVYYTAAMKDFVSGPMEIKVNNVSSINNGNNNSLEQNRKPNGVNNNLLTDDVIIDVWQFNSEAAVPISGKIEQPVMKIRPTDGKIGFAFVNGPLYFSMGGSEGTQNYSYQYWMASYDFFTSVGFTYDEEGNSWGVAAGGDINSAHADKFQLMSSRWRVSQRDKDGSYSKNNSMRLESIGMKGTKGNTADTTEYFDKQRIRSPSLAATVHENRTNLYMAYYDAMNDELRFKAGRENDRNSYILKVLRIDNPGSNFAGGWVELSDKNALADDDFIYVCDKSGNLIDKQAYRLSGYYTGEYTSKSKQVAFIAKNENGETITPFPGTDGKEVEFDGTKFKTLKEDVYIKVVKNIKSFVNGSSFYDFDTTAAPYSYRNESVNIVAGDGADKGAGEYVSLGVVPGTAADNDVVVITWYDTNARTLYYSYNTTPLKDRRGKINKAGEEDRGWSEPMAVFSGNEDYEYAGEYCKIAVDKKGGIHIAAYDPVNLDLVYAYASAYNASFTTCVVDSNGVVGSNLTLDVALVDGRVSPYIGYYATSCIKPKIAFYTGETPAGETALVHGFTSSPENGSSEDLFTGNWECSVVPTSKVVEMQSNQHNDINIGVWKDSSGIRKASSTGTSSVTNRPDSYDSTSNGQIYGNGTDNPVLGYAVKKGSSGDTIETAQLK